MIFEHRETVRFGHVDAAGIVFYPRIHEWVSNAVEAWFAEALDAPYARLHGEQRAGVPILRSRGEFHRPSRLGDELRHVFAQLDPLKARTIPDRLRGRMRPYLA